MVKNSIKVYARLKREDANKKLAKYEIFRRTEHDDVKFICNQLPDARNNKSHKYRFRKVFDQTSTQGEVFDSVAKPIINSVVNGFNGTILAYGQTGSGKTYAITGSPNQYDDRGILPRSIQQIFEYTNNTSSQFTVYISYLEIYNESGYDLLNPKQQPSSLEELPRVVLLEDGNGEAHLRNLSALPVTNEQEAMRLLFLGDTNRTIAETPMNEYSSRSHCIFTIYLATRSESTGKIRRSKLHLVDLAGSERIHKSNISGITLNEAKHINLSLHYLEQVILALSQTNRSHIPYRNSMMTYILRDSLSGNSLTAMLATLAVTQKNLEETMTTCKFAQRVACISTEAVINEEIDPQQEILFLRNEVDELRRQLNLMKSINSTEKLNLEQEEQCKKAVQNYINGASDVDVDLDMRQIHLCFQLFKDHINKKQKQKENSRYNERLETELVQKYKDVINQKDEEISVLRLLLAEKQEETPEKEKRHGQIKFSPKPKNPFGALHTALTPIENDALEIFLMDQNNKKDISINQEQLDKKYEMAKHVAATIQKCQHNIIDIRKKLSANVNNPEITEKLNSFLISQQNIYRQSILQLQSLKNEVDYLKEALKQAKIKLLRKFKEWINPEKNVQQRPERDTSCSENDVFNCLEDCSNFINEISLANSAESCTGVFGNNNGNYLFTNQYNLQDNQCLPCWFNEQEHEKLDRYENSPSRYRKDSELSSYFKVFAKDDMKENYRELRSRPSQDIFFNQEFSKRDYCCKKQDEGFNILLHPENISCLSNAHLPKHPLQSYEVMKSAEIDINGKNSLKNIKSYKCQESRKESTSSGNLFVFPELLCPSRSLSQENLIKTVALQENNRNEQEIKIKDSSEFIAFMKTVPLTGDPEVDDEIFNFYRTKFSSIKVP